MPTSHIICLTSESPLPSIRFLFFRISVLTILFSKFLSSEFTSRSVKFSSSSNNFFALSVISEIRFDLVFLSLMEKAFFNSSVNSFSIFFFTSERSFFSTTQSGFLHSLASSSIILIIGTKFS